jgi:hypothetical protein
MPQENDKLAPTARLRRLSRLFPIRRQQTRSPFVIGIAILLLILVGVGIGIGTGTSAGDIFRHYANRLRELMH